MCLNFDSLKKVLLQETNADSVTEQDDPDDEDIADDDDDVEYNNDQSVPHTDVPELLYVEEDEFTEKINVNNELNEQISEEETENKINNELYFKRILKEEYKTKPTEYTSVNPPLFIQSQKQFSKPELEVINAANEKPSNNIPDALKPKEEFLTQSDPNKTNVEQKSKTRVAFADPTLSIQVGSK